MDRDPLETWVHEKGTAALLGDACHPMLVRFGPLLAARDCLLNRFLQHSHTARKALQWQ